MGTIHVEQGRQRSRSTEGCHDYKAFGFSIRSCIPCPEMTPHLFHAPDITIRYGRVPKTLENPSLNGVCFQSAPGLFLLTIRDVARYMATGGNDIIIERSQGAADADVRVFLLGSVIGALLHQRGVLPLHASAVMAPDHSAILFTGESGTGKSTLAAVFQSRGLPALADDLCAIEAPGTSMPLLYPGLPGLKLWADAARKLGLNPADLAETRPGLQKYCLQTPEAIDIPLPIKHVYILRLANRSDIDIQKLRGMEKIEELLQKTYHFASFSRSGGDADRFRQCAALGKQADISRVVCPRGDFQPHHLADLLEKDFS